MIYSFKESISGTINLLDDDPTRRVLCFLCRQTYNENDQDVEPKRNMPVQTPMQEVPSMSDNTVNDFEHRKAFACNNLNVYLAADKFSIFPLKQLASYKLSAWFENYWMTSLFPKVALDIMAFPLRDSSLLNDLVKVGSLVVPLPPVPSTASNWEKLANEASHYPRLRVAEESARSWYTGILAFCEDVRGIV